MKRHKRYLRMCSVMRPSWVTAPQQLIISTSLPLLLVFEDDIQQVQNRYADDLLALAAKGLAQSADMMETL